MTFGGMEGTIDQTVTLVGREAEVALLRRAVDGALVGRARLVLVAGEPGIGKTVLAETAASYAAGAGARVLWGACWEGEGTPAFWPWVQILRTYAASRRTDDLYTELGDGASAVSRLVPEIGRRFLTLTHTEEADPEQARFQLFDHIAGFLRAAASSQPLVLVLDDLHWADKSSLSLLRFLTQATRDARVLMIGTYRDVEIMADHPFHETLGDVTADRIALHGLARDDVAELIRTTTGVEPSSNLAEAVFGRTTGNPFFVKEVARLLAAQGRLQEPASAYAIPEGVRDVVRRRLAHLDQDVIGLLGAASVLGPDFSLDVVARLTDRSTDETLAALDAALAARVVTEAAEVVGRFAFAHALLRDVLYEDLGAARRAALHWRAGELLEKRGNGDVSLAEVAYHLLNGVTRGDASRAADVAVRAARAALRMYAWDRAADLYARALDCLELAGADPTMRLRTWLELGDARTRSGDLAAARVAYIRAADLATTLELGSELAHAALGLGGGLGGFEVRLFDDEQIDLLNRSLVALGDEDSAVRAWVLARLSVASSFVRPAEERAALSREAIAMAERVGDRGAHSYALSSLCDALSGPDHVDDRLGAATEMIALASEPATGAARCGVESCAVCLCDPEFSLLGRRLRIVANLERGAIAEVDADIDAYARLADHLRQPLYLWYTPLFRGMRAMLRGDLSEAQRFVEEAAAIGQLTSSQNASVLVDVQRAGLLFQSGDAGAMARLWTAMIEMVEISKLPSTSTTQVLIEAMFGDIAAGRTALREWTRRGGMASLPRDSEWIPTACYAVEAAVRCKDRVSVEHLYDVLLPYDGLFAVDGIGAHVIGSVAHHLGVLAALLGRTEDAERHFRDAFEVAEAKGYALLAERSRTALRDAGAPSGADAAADGNVFRREGELWTIAYDGAVARMKDSKGLRDIATLLAQPGREVAALDFVTTDAGLRAQGDAGEILDDRARAAYKARIVELQAEIDDADPIAADRARAELDALTGQLAGAYGLGGRARRAGDPAERARKAVAERIRDAVAKVSRVNPALGRHLKASIRTGTFCSYEPERPVTWAF